MEIRIENMFFGWHKELPEAFIKLMNALVLTKDETEVRELMENLSQNNDFERFFAYGFGHHHLWVKQKCVPPPCGCREYRLLIVEF